MGEQMITMPVVALRGLTILPGMILHFDISRPRSMAAVERAMAGDQKPLLVAQRHPEIAGLGQGDLFQVGVMEVVKQLVELPGKMVHVLAKGLERAELLYLEAEELVMMGETATIEAEEDDLDSLTQGATLRILKGRLGGYGRINSKITKETLSNLLIIIDLNETLDQIVIQLPWDYTIHQTVLKSNSLPVRHEVAMHTLLTEMEIHRIKRGFQGKVKVDVDQNQEERILGEQTKVIRQELGEDAVSNADEYQKELDTLKTDKEVKEKLHKEIERFRNTPAGSQEASMLRTYVETLLGLPWKKMSKDNGDIGHVEKMLNEDHYGLEQVKGRILEYLAIRALTKKGISPIICLVGPPGTGKTPIVRSVARTLNKKYMHINLGGVRDGAEIRRRRRTYVDTMPGRIVEDMRRASVSNPLMLLDEIDKVNSDYRGNTSSALSEVLDGEQNVKFRSHYMEPPIDLSQVLFITMANTAQTISGLLLNRMGLIEVNGYMKNEKSHMARDYPVSKQMERNGLKDSQITSPDKSLEKIAHNYTREVSVRNLEYRTGDICRKVTRQFLEDKRKSIKISGNNLEKYLDKEKMTSENASEEDETGIVYGLTWISAGGDTLQIEVSMMPSKGSLPMTGQLGDMMKGSIQTALIYMWSVCPEYGVADDYSEKHDLHIYTPEGMVPKDGPSTGVTMAAAMLPVMTGKSVQAKVAMTGEVTLRGRIPPIGGLREKILTARVAHIEEVLVPGKNRPDTAELSKEIIKGLDTVYIRVIEDVVPEVFAQSTNRNQEKQI